MASTHRAQRHGLEARDIVGDIWAGLRLPPSALDSLSLPGKPGPAIPSSFKIGSLAQGTIALSALAAALIYATRNSLRAVPRVTVPRDHALLEFQSERLYVLDGRPVGNLWGPIGGLHRTSDGHVRIHDGFPHHRAGAVDLLGLPPTATRTDVSDRTRRWKAVELETAALGRGLAVYALRSYAEWDALPQAGAVADFPVSVERIGPGAAGLPARMMAAPPGGGDKCLRGLRVVELSRVIAAPVCGRALAAHGADVLWVTSPALPDLPALDRDLARGKRTIQLDLDRAADRDALWALLDSCDVFVQGYRPGSLAARGFSAEAVARRNPGVVCANLSAFGSAGPWAGRRGFDSLVQTCSGMNVSEAERFGAGDAARPMPCQALDHGAGYLLAAGVLAALHRRAVDGGSYRVGVSLAGTAKYLRSLGQYPGRTGFEDAPERPAAAADVDDAFLETRRTGFGEMKAVRHSASVEGCLTGWDVMPKPLGSDKPEWLA